MAIKEYNVDLDIKGKVLATTVPNSTGSIVTWNSTTKVFGLRTNAQIISDLGLTSVVSNSHTHSNKSILDGITSTKVSNWDAAYGWGNHASAGYALASSLDNYIFNVTNNSSRGRVYHKSSGSVQYANIPVIDTRSTLSGLGSDGSGSYIPLGDNNALNSGLTPLFHYRQGATQWVSSLIVKGWNGPYSSWKISGTAHNSNSYRGEFYLSDSDPTTGEWSEDYRIWHSGNFTPSDYVPYTGATANVNLGTRSITSTGGFIGNASTATTLATARTINGTSFNGSANIVTARWGTARNITIGNTTKSVNGSANVSWSLAEIGAAPNISGGYLEKSSLFLSQASAWDTLNENRIVGSGSAADSPYTAYGIGINLYHSDSYRGQLFLNQLANGTLQFRSANSTGWSAVKTVATVDQIPTSNDFITTNTNQTGLAGNKSVDGTWTFNSQINTANHGNSSQWKQAYDWGDFRDYGLGVGQSTAGSWDFDVRESGFVSNNDHGIPGWSSGRVWGFKVAYSSTAYGVELAMRDGRAAFQTRENGTDSGWLEIVHDNNLDSKTSALGFIKSSALSGYVPTSRTIIAGNGLTGGGTLAANRTITLGTPGSIGLSSTNSVSSTSHTHALDSATTTAINQGVTAHGWGDFRDYGLGTGANIISDFDNQPAGSMGYTTTATLNQPSGLSYGSLFRFGSTSSFTQIFGEYTQSNRLFFRHNRNGVYYPLVEIIHEGNLDTQATSLGFIKSSALPTVNNGQLTLSTGTGLTGSATFTANQAGGSTFSVAVASTHKLPTTAEWASALVNTTYTAGTGLSLSGTTFGQAITTSGTGTYVQSITQTANGFQVNLGTPPNSNTTYSLASAAELASTTSTTARLISGQRLNAWATTKGFITSVPTMTATVEGTAKLFSATVQSVAATAVSATASRTYGIQKNSSGQLVVNVPWTNTTYSAGSLSLLTAGTNTTNRVWSAKNLHDGIMHLINQNADSIFAYSPQGGLYTTNWSSNALGQYALAIGHASNATAQNATAVGSAVFTGGFGSTNVGFSSNVNKSLAGNFGTYNTNNHRESFTYGLGLQSASTWQTVIGRYNKPNGAGDIDNWTDIRNPIFILGVGQDEMNRKNSVSAFGDGRLDYEYDRDDTHWNPNTIPDIRWINENVSGGGGGGSNYVDQHHLIQYGNDLANGLVLDKSLMADSGETEQHGIISVYAKDTSISIGTYGSFTYSGEPIFRQFAVTVKHDILVTQGCISTGTDYDFTGGRSFLCVVYNTDNDVVVLIWDSAGGVYNLKSNSNLIVTLLGEYFMDNGKGFFNMNPQIL